MDMDQLEGLLEKPYWVVDILPEQVPAGSPGQYFAVDDYFLKTPQLAVLHRKFAEILLKLNCYFDVSAGRIVDDEWTCGPGINGVSSDPDADIKDGSPGPDTEPDVWVRNPALEKLADACCSEDGIWTLYFYFEAEDTLIGINCDDTYMTVYQPTDRLLDLIRKLAAAEGLFVWQPDGAFSL